MSMCWCQQTFVMGLVIKDSTNFKNHNNFYSIPYEEIEL